jgi:hypothetical protein
MRAAAVLEERDVLGLPRETAAREIVEIAENVPGGDHARLKRDLDLADVVHRRVPAVDKDPRAGERPVVRLAHVRAEGADQVHVLAGTKPVAAQDRGLGRRGRSDDVGLRDGLGEVRDRRGVRMAGGEIPGP